MLSKSMFKIKKFANFKLVYQVLFQTILFSCLQKYSTGIKIFNFNGAFSIQLMFVKLV